MLLKFPHGAVLVTAQALPQMGGAFESGGRGGDRTGERRRASRQCGPRIRRAGHFWACRQQPRLLQNDELVTIDADGLTIYRGCVESLLAKSGEVRKNLMEGSPVYEILRDVTQHIVPLHLLDPDASDFKPKKCRTLHDITRFCHEKSVKEMFSFGKEHHFSERASKQLVCDVKMLWWIINLDDGFREDVPGKYVHLDNIVSIPMLALWEGIIAIPWEGPPPVDTRGFMSVLLEASANPALDPSMPSVYTRPKLLYDFQELLQPQFTFRFSFLHH